MGSGSIESGVVVSVITPSFNMGRWLPECLESVRAQGHHRVEHIVVDGGSTDGTVAILRDSEVRWVSEPDRGQSDAINKGLRMATGDVLGWLNADDTLLPGAIDHVVTALADDPRVGLVYGDIEQVENGVTRRVAPAGPVTSDALWRGNLISQPGTFWTRWAQDQVGLIDESFHLAMDYELWLRFARDGIPAVYVQEPLARFVVHEGSKTGSQDLLAFAEEESRALRKHGEVHGAAMAIDRWYWDDVRRTVSAALRAGDLTTAASTAGAALPRMHRVLWPMRLYLFACRVVPRAMSLIDRSLRHPG